MANPLRAANGQLLQPGHFVPKGPGNAGPAVAEAAFFGVAATGTTLTPQTGSVDVQGYAPALRMTLAPTTGDLTITGYVPAVSSSVRIAPETGGVDITGYAPAFTLRLVPQTGSVDITGYAPVVTTATLVRPSTGNVIVTGYAPSIIVPVTLTPTTGGVDLTGYVPGVVVVAPNTQPVSLGGSRHRGFMVDDYVPQRLRVLAVPSGAAFVVRGYAPSIRRSVRIADSVDIEIPDEVLAAALDLLDEEWETA